MVGAPVSGHFETHALQHGGCDGRRRCPLGRRCSFLSQPLRRGPRRIHDVVDSRRW